MRVWKQALFFIGVRGELGKIFQNFFGEGVGGEKFLGGASGNLGLV